MKMVPGQRERHGDAILGIFNEAIVNTTVVYDYAPRAPETMGAWFERKAAGNYPVIVMESDGGVLMGFATYGTFRAFPAYKYTVEHSVYVEKRYRRQGLGRKLLKEIIAA